MNPSTADRRLQGQTRIAQKVYDAIPMNEAWTSRQICSELYRLHQTAHDLHIVEGCLRDLREQKLIREPYRGQYQRIARTHLAIAESAEVDTRKEAPVPEKKEFSIDEAERMAKSLRDLADQFEAFALQAMEMVDKYKREAARFEQLRSLFKD